MKQRYHDEINHLEKSEVTKRLGLLSDPQMAKGLRNFEDALIRRGQILPRRTTQFDEDITEAIRDCDQRSG